MTGPVSEAQHRQSAEKEPGDAEKKASTQPDPKSAQHRDGGGTAYKDAGDTGTITTTTAVAADPLIQVTSADLASPPPPEDDLAPDGGWLAWSQVLSAHIATMLSWGYGTGFAVFQLYYKQHLGLPTSQVSWIGSIQLFMCFEVGVLSGRLVDAGHARACYLAGTVLTMGFVNGAAQGVFPGATASLVPDVSRLGSWVGMIFSLCGFATLAGPPVMGAIIDASNGSYVWAQIWAGLVIILGAACTLLTARMVGKRRAAKDEGGELQHGFFLKA